MKKKYILTPFSELILALVLLAIIAVAVRSCVNGKDNEQVQTNEMLEYHSAPNQLTIECDGYIKIVKQ